MYFTSVLFVSYLNHNFHLARYVWSSWLSSRAVNKVFMGAFQRQYSDLTVSRERGGGTALYIQVNFLLSMMNVEMFV